MDNKKLVRFLKGITRFSGPSYTGIFCDKEGETNMYGVICKGGATVIVEVPVKKLFPFAKHPCFLKPSRFLWLPTKMTKSLLDYSQVLGDSLVLKREKKTTLDEILDKEVQLEVKEIIRMLNGLEKDADVFQYTNKSRKTIGIYTKEYKIIISYFV